MTQQTVKATEITFPFSITYYLNAAGREASLLQGGDGREEQKITGQITLEQAKRTGRVITEQGGISDPGFDFRYGSTKLEYSHLNPAESSKWDYEKRYYDQPQTFESLWQDYVELFDARQALISEAKAERERLAAEFLADAQARAEFNYNGAAALLKGKWTHSFAGKHPVLAEANKRKEADAQKRREQAERAKAEREAEEAERQAAKERQIAEWVAAHGNENQKERFAAGLFPADEAVRAIKEAAFAPLSEFPEYERITNKEVRADCDENCRCNQGYGVCEINCTTADNVPATAIQWEQIKKMRALLPEAEFALRRHDCECDDDDCEDAGIRRHSIYVKIQVGGFTFNRNYAV